MMKELIRPVALCCAMVLAASCASTRPPRYYTLDMTPAGAAATAVNIDVDRFRVSDALTRPNILIHASPTEITYYALDHWAASLRDLVAEKLEAEFGPTKFDAETFLVTGDILAFGQEDTAQGVGAIVKLDLQIRRANARRYEDAVIDHVYEARVAAAEDSAAAAVRALSKATESIAAQIAADVGRLELGTGNP